MVVSIYAGREAVRAYVAEQARLGVDHVRSLVKADNERVKGQIEGLSEEQGKTVTPADEWSVYDVLRHMAASLDRSRTRLESMSSGRPFENPSVAWGQTGEAEFESFVALRGFYLDRMASIIEVLERADGKTGLNLTAEHRDFGPFTWPEWATYSHHVHVHDHIGQLEKISAALRAG